MDEPEAERQKRFNDLVAEIQKIKSISGLSAFLKRDHSWLSPEEHVTVCARLAQTVIRLYSVKNEMFGYISDIAMALLQIGKCTKSPIKCLPIDDMLYPQYAIDFHSLSEKEFEHLQQSAKKMLESEIFPWFTDAKKDAALKKHWQSIVDGAVPFQYGIKERFYAELKNYLEENNIESNDDWERFLSSIDQESKGNE